MGREIRRRPVGKRGILRHRVPVMATPASINSQIIEGLYCEALVLSDEVRSSFDLSDNGWGHPSAAGTSAGESDLRVALSCEALRTMTRMMHAVAWLLNHRAFFMGELSEFQLRQHVRLADFPPADQARFAQIDARRQHLIRATEQFYERLRRLDTNWRQGRSNRLDPVAQMQQRLEAVGAR